jgi:hypothetical protein
MKLKEKLLIKIVHLFGYENLFFEKNGICVFVGDKYDNMGWTQFEISFRKFTEKRFFQGDIDEIRMSNKKLSKKEIKEYYNFGNKKGNLTDIGTPTKKVK